jgi:methylglyoxal synthase
MHIALIAHDVKKDLMVVLVRDFVPFLSRCHVMATGTTGSRLIAEAGLEVERLFSGPLGGDL